LIEGVIRAKRPARLPVILAREEVRAVLGCLEEVPRLVALLLNGAGLRILDALCLRIQDVDFARRFINVRRRAGSVSDRRKRRQSSFGTARAARIAAPCCPPPPRPNCWDNSIACARCSKKTGPTR
jgi:integrase